MTKGELLNYIYEKIGVEEEVSYGELGNVTEYKDLFIGDILYYFELQDSSFYDWRGAMVSYDFQNTAFGPNQSRYGQLSDNGKMIVDLFALWEDKRTCLDDQPDECIEFIYKIILSDNES